MEPRTPSPPVFREVSEPLPRDSHGDSGGSVVEVFVDHPHDQPDHQCDDDQTGEQLEESLLVHLIASIILMG